MSSRQLAKVIAGILTTVAAALLLYANGGDDGSKTTTTATSPAPTVTDESPPPTEAETTESSTTGAKPADDDSIPADHRAAIGEVLVLIEAGGPFPHDQDGTVFQNREGLLPQQPQGYYHEYTVPTPGSPDRGARRLVTGDGGEVYYTSDHYSSFTQIDPDDFK